MPKLPKWLADASEQLLSKHIHPAIVTEISYIHPQLKKIQFKGDFLNAKFTAGNAIKVRINTTDYRNYTPSVFDPEKGICEAYFYLHGKGPGSEWISRLNPGDTINIMGPGGRFGYQKESKYHILFGDETSLGLHLNLKDRLNRDEKEYLSILELDKEHQNWANTIGLNTSFILDKHPENAEQTALQFWQHIEDLCTSHWKDCTFYLTGKESSVLAIRKKLKSNGIMGKQIQTQVYWSPGKIGL